MHITKPNRAAHTYRQSLPAPPSKVFPLLYPVREAEWAKVLPGVTACRLTIQLSENGDGCFADVTYNHTSIGPAGDEFVGEFTADYYQKFMQAWENELNHFLKNSSRHGNENPA
jgi:hypothetical protein